MEEWKEYKLGDVASVQTGPFGSQLHNKDYVKAGTPIVTVEHLGARLFSTQNLPCVSDVDKVRLGKYTLEEGDIVFSRVGSVDRCSYVSAKEVGWLFSGRCLRVRCNDTIQPMFLYYYLQKEEVKQSIRNIAVGATMPSINTKLLSEIQIIAPSKTSQKLIATTLSSLDDKIECNRRINDNFTLSFLLLTCFVLWLLKLRNDNLQYQAQALYKSWFVDYEPFKDGEFVESELGMIPKGWRVGTLREILEIKYGKDHKRLSDGIIPVYGSGGLMRYAEKPLYEGESVLIPRKGTLNNVMYVNEAFWTVDTMFYTIPKTQNSILFAYILLSNKDLASMNSGSAVPSMTTEILNNIQFVMPVSDVLAEFNPLVSTYYAQIKHYDQESRRLAQLRDTLLPRLMSGELEVNKVNCLS